MPSISATGRLSTSFLLPGPTKMEGWFEGQLEPTFVSRLHFRSHSKDRTSACAERPGRAGRCGRNRSGTHPVAEAEIEAFRRGLERCQSKPYPLLTVGKRVRIFSGVFAGTQGIVFKRKSGFRVVLTLEEIMQSIAVEVDERDLEPFG